MIKQPIYEDGSLVENVYVQWEGEKTLNYFQAFVGDPYPMLFLLLLDDSEVALIRREYEDPVTVTEVDILATASISGDAKLIKGTIDSNGRPSVVILSSVDF